MPRIDAIDADADHLLPVGASMRTLGPRPGLPSPLLKAHGAGILCERADERGQPGVARRTALQARAVRRTRRRTGVARRAHAPQRGRWRGSPTARRPDSAGTPSRTGRVGGSRRGARPRARSARAWTSISAAFCMRTRVRWSRNVVWPISAYARWSWRRDEATRRAMSSSDRSEAYSRSTISAASWNSEVRRRMVEARCVGTYLLRS